jgi:hypothetical protein
MGIMACTIAEPEPEPEPGEAAGCAGGRPEWAALPGRPLAAVNLHIVGVILIVTGVLRLLLLPRQRGPAPSGGLGRLVNPSGFDDPRVHDDQTAAAIDVANIREGENLVSPSGPGDQPDEL